MQLTLFAIIMLRVVVLFVVVIVCVTRFVSTVFLFFCLVFGWYYGQIMVSLLKHSELSDSETVGLWQELKEQTKAGHKWHNTGAMTVYYAFPQSTTCHVINNNESVVVSTQQQQASTVYGAKTPAGASLVGQAGNQRKKSTLPHFEPPTLKRSWPPGKNKWEYKGVVRGMTGGREGEEGAGRGW